MSLSFLWQFDSMYLKYPMIWQSSSLLPYLWESLAEVYRRAYTMSIAKLFIIVNAWKQTTKGLWTKRQWLKKKKTRLYGGVCVCVGVCVQSCLTLCGPMECIPPGSSVHGIFQARLLKWVTISSTMQYLDRIGWISLL